MTAGARALRYLIIGAAGAVAEKHVRALARLPAELVAMCDVDQQRGRARARDAGCAFGDDAAGVLRSVKPDVAVICTPPSSHAVLARESLLLGIHVLVEKPMAVEVAEADELVALAERSGAILAVNFGERFRSSVEYARTVLERGELGRVLRVASVHAWRRDPAYYTSSAWRGTWRGEGGGVLMNQAPHPLDLLCHLLGSPSRVWGTTRTLKHAIECEDTAHAMFEYASGALGSLAVTTAQGTTERHLEIVGDRAVLTWQGDKLTMRHAVAGSHERSPHGAGPAPAHEPLRGGVERALEDVTFIDHHDPEVGLHEAVHRDLRRAIVEGTRPRCDAREGRMSLELANAIALSNATGGAVSLPLDRRGYSHLLRQHRGC